MERPALSADASTGLAVLGRAITIGYGVFVLVSALAVLARTEPAQWLVLLPYFVLEFGTMVVVLLSPRPSAWADGITDVLVPVVTTFFYSAVVWWTRPAPVPGVLVPIGQVVLAAAYAWCAWSLLHLRQNFSILPEVRGLVTTGPYAAVRHPLYLGYLGTVLAGVLIDRSWVLAAAGVVWIGLFSWRGSLEEAKLADAFPAYRAYQARTGRLWPRRSKRGDTAASA